MKRGAEKQGGRGNRSDDDMDETETTGFVAADPKVLAGRPMKAMPKRGFAMTVTPQNPPSNGVTEAGDSEQPKVEGFKFGGLPTSNPFSFTPPSTTPSTAPQTQKTVFSNASFTPTPLSSTTNVFGSTPTQPPLASKTTISQQTSPFMSQPSSSTTDQKLDERNQVALDTFLSMRGLNINFLDFITEQLKINAFLDLSKYFKQYEDHKAIIPKPKSTETSSATNDKTPNLPNPFNPTPVVAKPSTSAPVFSMPTPPKSFTGFSFESNTMPSSSKTPESATFFKQNSAFSFTPVATKTDDAPKAKFFSFTTPPELKPDQLPSPPKSSFTFGTSTTKPSTDTSRPQSAFGSTLGSSIFSSKDNQTSSFGSTTTIPNAFSVFGNATSSSGNTDTTPPTPPALTFGSSSSGNSFGAFKNKGSLGNPVGFSFGSSTPTPEPETPFTSNSATSVSPFFSATSTSLVPMNNKDKGVESSVFESENSVSHTLSPTSTDSRALTPSTEVDETPKVLGSNPHDEEGEGEEDEETTHSCRIKVYKLRQADGKSQWTDMGVGVLRLKKHKINDGRRMLLRNSSTGKITINFKIFAALKPARDKNAVAFVGHDDGKPATYRLRLKTEEQAIELHRALDREIEFVKAKDNTR